MRIAHALLLAIVLIAEISMSVYCFGRGTASLILAIREAAIGSEGFAEAVSGKSIAFAIWIAGSFFWMANAVTTKSKLNEELPCES
jgi:hypothetical protein